MKILILGAGRMGFGAAYDLVNNSPGVESVTVADFDAKKAKQLAVDINPSRIAVRQIDAGNYQDTLELMRGHDAAISCVNYWYNESLSRAAIVAGVHFCDLGGNSGVVDKQLALDSAAMSSKVSIIPDCGLAPGFVSILATHGAKRFDSLDELHIRVGGLPQNPQPPLNYQLTFSVEGLINEYLGNARVIRNGKPSEVPTMTEIEEIAFDGFPPLEAFQTSGGTSTLPDSFKGKVRELDYKTIRYAGHCNGFRPMLDIGLGSSEAIKIDSQDVNPRRVLGTLLEKSLPADEPDYVLVRLEFVGKKDSELTRLRYDIVDKHDDTSELSAMMRTTAFPASIIAQMMARGEVSRRGAVPQEIAIDPDKFVAELERRNIKADESLHVIPANPTKA